MTKKYRFFKTCKDFSIIQLSNYRNSTDALDTFLAKFDKDWVRYNKDIIAKVKKYEEGGE